MSDQLYPRPVRGIITDKSRPPFPPDLDLPSGYPDKDGFPVLASSPVPGPVWALSMFKVELPVVVVVVVVKPKVEELVDRGMDTSTVDITTMDSKSSLRTLDITLDPSFRPLTLPLSLFRRRRTPLSLSSSSSSSTRPSQNKRLHQSMSIDPPLLHTLHLIYPLSNSSYL